MNIQKKTYTLNNKKYVSLVSLYKSNLFPTFFKPIRMCDPTLSTTNLRDLLQVYNISSEKYILVFSKDFVYGEPYIRDDLLQVLMCVES